MNIGGSVGFRRDGKFGRLLYDCYILQFKKIIIKYTRRICDRQHNGNALRNE